MIRHTTSALCNPGVASWTLTCFYASAAVNWLKKKVNQFAAAQSLNETRAAQSRDVGRYFKAPSKMKFFLLLIITFFLKETIFCQSSKEIEKNRFIKSKNNKLGITDSLNKVIVPFIYDFIDYKNNRLIVQKNNSQGLITTDNQVILPISYKFILARNYNRFILWTQNSLFGLCDTTGQELIPAKYKNLSSTENDDFYISNNQQNLNGVFNFNGKTILPEAYKFYTIDNYKIFATKDNQPIIINLNNLADNIVLDKEINFIETQRHYSSGEQLFQIIKKDNKFGLINSDNEILLPIIYDELKSSQHWKYYLFRNKGKIGIINIKGQIIKEPIFDSIELRKEYIVLKQKNKKDEYYSYQQ